MQGAGAHEIPFSEIAAARHKLHEQQAQAGGEQALQDHLQHAERVGHALKVQVAQQAGEPVRLRAPLPGHTQEQANSGIDGDSLPFSVPSAASELASSAKDKVSGVLDALSEKLQDAAVTVADRMAGIPKPPTSEGTATRVADMLSPADTPYPGDDQRSSPEEAHGTGTPGASDIRAHSPVELPSAHPAQVSTSQAPTSPRRVPSGLIMCSGSSHLTDLTPVTMTSVPGSAVQEYCPGPDATPGGLQEEMDSALAAALSGAGGMEMTGHELPSHSAYTATHKPPQPGPTRAQQSSGGGGGASGGSELGKLGVWHRLFSSALPHAHADTGGGDDAAEPQMAGHQDYNPIDSNQTMNMGPPSAGSGDRAAFGGLTMALGGITDRIAHSLHNVVETGATLLGDAGGGLHHHVQLGDLPAGMPGSMPEDEEYRELRLEKAREAAEARRLAHEEALAATQAAADAARAGNLDALQQAAEKHHAADDRTIAPAAEGGDGGAGTAEHPSSDLPNTGQSTAEQQQDQEQRPEGGVVKRLVGRVADALHLHPSGPDAHSATASPSADTAEATVEVTGSGSGSRAPGAGGDVNAAGPSAVIGQEGAAEHGGSPHQQPVQPQDYKVEGRQSAEERRAHVPTPVVSGADVHVPQRAAVHPGTFEFERPPVGEHAADVREQLGIPRAATRNAQLVGDVNLKEGGQMAPAGAMGQSRANPDAYIPSHAVEAAQPNFFKEVGKRGLVDVIEHGVANVKEGLHKAGEELSHGGSPSPWSITSGGVSDTKDITRNVERIDHLDDPLQRRIYDAETYKVPALHAKVVHDQQSEEERLKEASNAVVLGKNKPISGAVPHDKPEHPIGASGTPSGVGPKTAAGKSMYDAIGTAQGCGPEGTTAGAGGSGIREAVSHFMDHEEHVEQGQSAPVVGGFSAKLAHMFTSALSKVVPESKAMFPSEGTRRPPTANWGDNVSGRPPMKEGAGRADAHDIPIIPGADIQHQYYEPRAHTEAEGADTKDATPERLIYEEVKSTLMGGPDAAGIPHRGVDQPGGYETMVVGDLADRGHKRAQQAVENLPDTLSRVGESVGGAVQHVVNKAHDAVADFPVNLYGQTWPRESEQKRAAKATGDEELGAFDIYSHPGGVGGAGVEHGGGRARVADTKSGAEWSYARTTRMEGLLEEPEPARKRDTFMDKVLYPFSKDAGDPTAAKEKARSYLEYVEEKQALLEQVSQEQEEAKSAGGRVSQRAAEVKGQVEGAASKVKEVAQDVKEGVQEAVAGSSGSGKQDEAHEHGAHGGLRGLAESAVDAVRHMSKVDEPPKDAHNSSGNKPLQSVSGKEALQSDAMPYGGVTGRTAGPPGAGTGPLDPTKPLHHVYGGGAGDTGLRIPPVIQQAADRMPSGRTQLDDTGAPVTEGDAARLEERRHTAANPDLKAVHDTTDNSLGTAPRYDTEQKRENVVHVTGDVVTEVVANLGQAVMDTVASGLSTLLGTRPTHAPAADQQVEQTKQPRQDEVGVAEAAFNSADVGVGVPGDDGVRKAEPPEAAPASTTAGEVLREGADEVAAGVQAGVEGGAGLTGRVLGALSVLLGTNEHHKAGGDVSQAADEGAEEMREKARRAMEPAGPPHGDFGGYGRAGAGGAAEEGKPAHAVPDIPVVPFTSTEELLKQKAQQQEK